MSHPLRTRGLHIGMSRVSLRNMYRICGGFGDSNPYGYDPRSYLGGHYPESICWTALLIAAGWQDVMKQRHIGWVSLSQIRGLGELSLPMTVCIFLRKAIWLSLREYR